MELLVVCTCVLSRRDRYKGPLIKTFFMDKGISVNFKDKSDNVEILLGLLFFFFFCESIKYRSGGITVLKHWVDRK